MKKAAITALVLALLIPTQIAAVSAIGSSFGSLTTAQAVGQGRGNLGMGLGIADGTSFVSVFTYGLSKYTDGRLKLGLYDPGDRSDTKFVVGGDVKWQFWNVGPNTTYPFDFATGGFFEYLDLGSTSVFQIGGHLIASFPMATQSGRTLVPYGRFNARLESISFARPAPLSGSDSDSNLEIGLSGGVQWQMTTTVSLFGEFQIDGNDGLFIGVDFNVM